MLIVVTDRNGEVIFKYDPKNPDDTVLPPDLNEQNVIDALLDALAELGWEHS